MSNVNFNRLLFQLFWEQNAEKTFDDFGTLGGSDNQYSDIKIKDFELIYYKDRITIECDRCSLPLCMYSFKDCIFYGFAMISEININILDYISFEDNV